MKSMTAYGRATAETAVGLVRLEIQSVNRKGLDISVQLPKEWLFIEMTLRQRIAKSVSRGYVTLRLALDQKKSQPSQLPDRESLKKLQESLKELSLSLGYDPHQAVSFEWLIKEALLTSLSPPPLHEERFSREVLAGLDKAIAAWLKMKEAEGGYLVKTLFPSLEKIKSAMAKISKIAANEPGRYREKLCARLKELDPPIEIDEDRLAREVALLADKVDVLEELDRLGSHCAQFHTLLAEGKGPTGKELGFLTQEMLREVNTCNAKLQAIEGITLALTIKSELEKIREQIQNFE